MTQPQQDPMEVAREIVRVHLFKNELPKCYVTSDLQEAIAQAILAERQASAAELADLKQLIRLKDASFEGQRDEMLAKLADLRQVVQGKDALIAEWQSAAGKTNRIIQNIHAVLVESDADKDKTIFEMISEIKQVAQGLRGEGVRLRRRLG